jgi:hypothetical protein
MNMPTLPESLKSYKQPPQSDILGRTEARIYTPPLRYDLFTNERASYGYQVIKFARDVLKIPLDEWQEWLVIRMGEYLEDDKTPRFTRVLIIVGRQNGKTHLLGVLTLFWALVEKWPEILGTNLSFMNAKKAMLNATKLAEGTVLEKLLGKPKEGNVDVSFTTVYGTHYVASAATRRAGRGNTLDRAIIDELREQPNWNTYDAAIPAMAARPLSQAVFATNAGYESSVVLNSLRTSAIEYIQTGSGDDALGLFEWSAPDGADFTDYADPVMWSYANPNLGRRLSARKLKSEALKAATGQQEMVSFRTEYLSQFVSSVDPAVDPIKWAQSAEDSFSLEKYQDTLTLALDVSIDRQHATLVGSAVLEDGRVGTQYFKEWEGADLLNQIRNELPGLIERYKPKVFGWLPGGPAAGLSTFLKERRKRRPEWARGVRIQEIGAEVTEVCEGFAAEVASMQLVHSNNSLVNAQVIAAEKLNQGDRWRFQRKGKGHVDAVYAAAGAVYLARTLTKPDDTIMTFR